MSVDPLAEKYPGMTPYNYVGNNPISRIDIKGDSITPLTTLLFASFAKQGNTFFSNSNFDFKVRAGGKVGAKIDGLSASVGAEYGSISFKSNFGKPYASISLGSMETNMSVADIGLKAKFTAFYTNENYVGQFLKGEVKAGMLKSGYSYDFISQEPRYSANIGPASIAREINFTNFIQESWGNFKDFIIEDVKLELPNLPKFQIDNKVKK